MTLVKFNNNGTGKDAQRVPFFSPMFTDVFDTFFGKDLPGSETGSFIPAVNITENSNEYRIEAALPGLKKEEVTITAENKVLTISGERKKETKEEEGKYSRREFSYGSFKRSFSLPETVETDKIAAVFTNGILTLTLPKRDEAKQKPARQIEIA